MTFISRVVQLVAIASLCGCSSAAVPRGEDVGSVSSDDAFSIRFRSLNVPVKRILLLRAKDEFCALRVNAYGTDVTDGKHVKYANYELFRTQTRNLPMKAREVERGRLEFKGYVGFGHWVWDSGNTVLKCGSHRIGWSYPNEFALLGDAEFTVAPTGWTSFSEIKFDDARLKWFAEDRTQKRGEIVIPVHVLPGFTTTVGGPGVAGPGTRSNNQTGNLP